MAIDTATFEATLDSKIDAATTSNDAKEFLLLAKAVEATNAAISSSSLSVSNNLSDVANAATALSNLGGVGAASPAFTGTPTAPTATAGTNTTQIATTAFVAGEVAGIVDSAPATLDTLNELAAALGDDANFSTTVTNSIATKMPLAGGTFTGSIYFGDSISANFGASSDLQIFHDGSNSRIQDAGVGSLLLDGSAVYARNSNGTKTMFRGLDGGAAELYYDNSIKLATTTGGVSVSGSCDVNGTLAIDEVYETVALNGNTSGTITFDTTAQGIIYFVNNQTANRTVNFTNVGANLSTGQSLTCTLLCDQGSTAYYLNAYQIDGGAVTPRWSGGSAPTSGNASGIDVYTFTIIRTGASTYTVLASQTQYA